MRVAQPVTLVLATVAWCAGAALLLVLWSRWTH
jgi:hypothetical protein